MSDRTRVKILNHKYETVKTLNSKEEAVEYAEQLQNEIEEKIYREKHKDEIEAWEKENETEFDPVTNSKDLQEEYEEPDRFYDYEEAEDWLEKNTAFTMETYLEPKYTHRNNKYFCGIEIEEYGRKNGYIDYKTLASAFEGVLCNGIMEKTENADLGYWEQENGEEDESNYEKEIFQEIIVDNNGANILKDFTDEILYYNEELDMHVWCITHYGTAWSHVLTEIPIRPDTEE